MFNCDWARALTRYDCRSLTAIDGQPCLEIGTPFSLPDGSAINLYLKPEAQFVRISDNADTLFQLGGMGIDVWNGHTRAALTSLVSKHRTQVAQNGELFLLAPESQSAQGFAHAIAAILAICAWASDKLDEPQTDFDLVAEVEPFIIARDPSAPFKRHFRVKGVSRADHVFDFRHGNDVIDVIPPHAGATGAAMRKAGDVQNGPSSESFQPLFIVDDRREHDRAFNEIEILGSITRAMPLSRLLGPQLH
ncbi:DUF1828 domain-containing protein [Achromobacter xylosoxidans]|uniref:DUF1828 domain-containing protein n=1 Tax=Alcaligenes xylosoxydans xylosoxydans TaxID=85698 RepID=UPI002354FFE7|nr:DUF1828 domain-containing protein [Achromobacter xylosoxidans]